jgi:hypothetical protein
MRDVNEGGFRFSFSGREGRRYWLMHFAFVNTPHAETQVGMSLTGATKNGESVKGARNGGRRPDYPNSDPQKMGTNLIARSDKAGPLRT